MTTVRLPRKSVLYQNVKLLRTDKARASCAIHLKSAETYDYRTIHARIQKIFSEGGGGVQIPRRGLTENFNMAKINNLAIITRWGGGGGGGGGGKRGPDHLSPPLDPPMRSACGFVSERRQRADSEIVRCPYDL